MRAPGCPTVLIILRIVFSIVFHCSCAGRFLSPAQGLALSLARFFHCRSIVFFPKIFSSARAGPSATEMRGKPGIRVSTRQDVKGRDEPGHDERRGSDK